MDFGDTHDCNTFLDLLETRLGGIHDVALHISSVVMNS